MFVEVSNGGLAPDQRSSDSLMDVERQCANLLTDSQVIWLGRYENSFRGFLAIEVSFAYVIIRVLKALIELGFS